MKTFAVAIIAALAAATTGLHGQLHTESSSEVIKEYETVYPQVLRRTRAARNAHAENLEVYIRSESGEAFTLQLTLNEKLIAPQFSSVYFDENGIKKEVTDQVNCFYQGHVLEHSEWMVAMDSCQGLRGSFGDQSNKTQQYNLEPLSSYSDSLEQPHALFLAADSDSEVGRCGVEERSSISLVDDEEELDRTRRQSLNTQYIVELYVVNDNAQYRRYERNITRTVNRALALINIADMLFRPENISVVAAHMETWSNGDRIQFSNNSYTTLFRFAIFSKHSVQQDFDAIVLLTEFFFGAIRGVAYTGYMCSGPAAAAVVRDAPWYGTSAGTVLAHELGHVLNMGHDDPLFSTATCACSDPSGKCIMARSAGTIISTQWSSCSRNDLRNALTRNIDPLSRCLENKPTIIVGGSVCGNRIVEKDETCDCGSVQECDDPCCNATTCRLLPGVQCTEGECCTSTCRFKAARTTCRNSSGECDIEEYCSGQSSECPEDLYVQDGTPCNNSQFYCFSGECKSHDKQCQYHFRSNKNADICYHIQNRKGQIQGNCGYNGTHYKACAPSDLMCGQLFCLPGRYQNHVQPVQIFTLDYWRCVTFNTWPWFDDIINSALVEDGTKCGDGKLCYEQRCVNVSSLGLPQCPRGSDGQICFGRGRCNNRAQCECEPGFAGIACQTALDECALGIDNCEHNCVNTHNSFLCTCNDGYMLASDSHSCSIIECGGRLTETSGSFQTPGWPRNYPQSAFRCEWIIELPNTTDIIEFTIDDSAYGISGRPPCPNDHIEFFDGIDSKAQSMHTLCKFENPGPIRTTSSQARVVFVARRSSSVRTRSGVKVDFITRVTPCSNNNGGCEHICVNTANSSECQCRSGYSLFSNGKNCTDVNECSTNNGGCQHNCVNTDGSYECECRSGYRLSSNGKTCTDIDECSEGTHNCAEVCINTDGSFNCSCNNGYTLAADGRSCGCGGRLTGASGSFQTPGWPQNYPQENFQCEWIIELPNRNARIEYTIQSPYGINGRPPCPNDYIEFFDGTDSGANSMHKLCRFDNPGPIRTTTYQARVVFSGSRNTHRPRSRVGVRVNYITV